ncbi:MAG: VWA domain-containing protein [Mogibacterium sp.]|nr:VWA domain-containing protein [Mogibacterium sp.]
MNIVEKIRKEMRGAVTTTAIFLSHFMYELLYSKLRLICKQFKVAVPDFRLMFDKQDEMTACTSLKDMTVNAGHEMFDGDDEHRLLKLAGVILHEVGHIIFTNYTAHFKWLEDISSGVFYPAEPVNATEDELEKLRKFATGPLQTAFLSIAHDLSNVLEDGRIENFILKYVRNARFMIKGLVRLRQETYAEMPAFEELTTKVAADEIPMIHAVIQLVLHYARFREIKGNFDPNTDLGDLMLKLIPEIDVYLEAKEAVVYYGAFNNMLLILLPVIGEYFDRQIERQQMSQGAKQQMKKQTGVGQNGSGSSQGSGQASASDAGSTSSDNGDSSSANGQPQNSGENSDSDGSGAAGAQGDSPSAEEQAEMQAAAEKIAQALKDALEQLIGTTVDQSANMGDQAKGSDRGSVKRQLAKMGLDGQGGEVMTENAANADDGSGTVSHAKAGDLDLNLVLQDIARKISDEEVEKAVSKEIKKEYDSVSSAVKDYSQIHKKCDITMYHYDDVSDRDKELYKEMARAVAPAVKRAVKSSNFYEKDRQSYTEDRLFSGRTLHAEQSYRRDGRIFSKRYDRDEPPKLAVAIRIDCSGSMSGDRIEAARRCCVFLYEYVLGMEKRYNVKIPLYIYGDNVSAGVRMYVFADDKFRTPNEKYRLMKLAAGGCNRDGLPIRMAVKRLEQEHPDAQKIIFNITDGQPNDHGYGGEAAFDDLRDITRYCEKHRIAIAACAIGSDRDKIEEIYGTSHFMNISDLNELPVRLVKIVRKLLK